MTVRLITTGDKNCPVFHEYIKRLDVDSLIFPGKLQDGAYVKKILPLLQGCIITLEVTGRQYTSVGFANFFHELRQQHHHLTFVCGPANGIPVDIQKKSNYQLSLSAMTLPHEIARIVLAEQIYRAHQIMAGHPYHK